MRPSTTVFLMMASRCVQSSAPPAVTLPRDSAQTPGTFSIPFNFTLGADAKFVATLAIGSQGTEIPIIMDLGSPFSWVYGPNDLTWGNQTNVDPKNCHSEVTPYYAPDNSTTAVISDVSWEASYGGNFKVVSGSTRAIDSVTSDQSSAGLLLPFLVADGADVRQLDTLTCQNPPQDYNGIFGISGSANLSQLVNASFRFNVQHPPAPQEPLIDSATMSVFVRNATTTPALQLMSGEVLLGGIDTSAFVGPLVQIADADIDPFFGYTVPLPTLSVGGVVVSFDPDLAEDGGGCLIDSGTENDVLPVNVIVNYRYDPSAFVAQTGLLNLTTADGIIVWAYPSACADIPANATFDYTWPSPSGQNITVKVPMRNYARSLPEVNNQSCALNIDTIGCILGAPFLSGTYFMVDDDAGIVAMAQAGEGTGGRLAIESGGAIPGLVV